MNIRPINKNDLVYLIRLYQDFWETVSNLQKMETLWGDLMNNPDYTILCAENDGIIVGTIMGIVCYELYGECEPFMVMENLVTDIKFRKKGIAKALLSELEIIAKEKACSQILFITENDRTDAVSFYKKMGYDEKSHVGFKKSL